MLQILKLTHYSQVKDGFKALSDILSLFPTICQDSHFLFIPGPQDPGPANILPRPALPASLTEPLTKRLAHAHMCSNPVRVQYCTQEWVLFRYLWCWEVLYSISSDTK